MSTNILQRNNVQVFGRGVQTLVFAHGFGCDQTMWRQVSRAFEHEYRVVLFDYVGSGHSDLDAYDDERYASADGYAQDIIEICAALELRNVILVGHSVSSMICMRAALQMPQRIEQLVMLCASPRFLNDAPDYCGGFEPVDIDALMDMMLLSQPGWAKYLAGVLVKHADCPEQADALEASFCAMDAEIARRFAAVTFLSDFRADLARLTLPTLLLQCTEDALVPSSVAEYLHRQLSGSTLQQMKASGHCPHMSHSKETIELMRAFLQLPARP